MGLSGRVPHRVDEATKTGLLDLIDEAAEAGWGLRRTGRVLELPERRVQRWQRRREAGQLADKRPGVAVHGLLEAEAEAILTLFEDWGETDRSHRKLAHRGSYTGRVWVSPASVRRVLTLADKHFRPLPRPGHSKKRPFPGWAEYTSNSIWIYDTTHFTRAGMAVLIIEDLVSRRWVTEVVSSEETSTQVEVGFTAALEAEGLLEAVDARHDEHRVDVRVDEPGRPILLAVSDNGPQMTSGSTRESMALCSIAQHFGRPGTPTDQAWVESFNGHLKGENPHLLAIEDPSTLRAELAVVREHYNTVRLHEGIGYVTPDDEHEGRGDAIRAARREGLEHARQRRLAHYQQARKNENPSGPRCWVMKRRSASLTQTHLSMCGVLVRATTAEKRSPPAREAALTCRAWPAMSSVTGRWPSPCREVGSVIDRPLCE
ncbi:integrase core domain-containing protein [Calidifontibacter indicus]|uniref:integrase core domain-containing protein n=1 Tax=Calidifontibacter indicus TaxID=419650 RepID=UPI003D705654